jgi:hypothetical protein
LCQKAKLHRTAQASTFGHKLAHNPQTPQTLNQKSNLKNKEKIFDKKPENKLGLFH